MSDLEKLFADSFAGIDERFAMSDDKAVFDAVIRKARQRTVMTADENGKLRGKIVPLPERKRRRAPIIAGAAAVAAVIGFGTYYGIDSARQNTVQPAEETVTGKSYPEVSLHFDSDRVYETENMTYHFTAYDFDGIHCTLYTDVTYKNGVPADYEKTDPFEITIPETNNNTAEYKLTAGERSGDTVSWTADVYLEYARPFGAEISINEPGDERGYIFVAAYEDDDEYFQGVNLNKVILPPEGGNGEVTVKSFELCPYYFRFRFEGDSSDIMGIYDYKIVLSDGNVLSPFLSVGHENADGEKTVCVYESDTMTEPYSYLLSDIDEIFINGWLVYDSKCDELSQDVEYYTTFENDNYIVKPYWYSFDGLTLKLRYNVECAENAASDFESLPEICAEDGNPVSRRLLYSYKDDVTGKTVFAVMAEAGLYYPTSTFPMAVSIKDPRYPDMSGQTYSLFYAQKRYDGAIFEYVIDEDAELDGGATAHIDRVTVCAGTMLVILSGDISSADMPDALSPELIMRDGSTYIPVSASPEPLKYDAVKRSVRFDIGKIIDPREVKYVKIGGRQVLDTDARIYDKMLKYELNGEIELNNGEKAVIKYIAGEGNKIYVYLEGIDSPEALGIINISYETPNRTGPVKPMLSIDDRTGDTILELSAEDGYEGNLVKDIIELRINGYVIRSQKKNGEYSYTLTDKNKELGDPGKYAAVGEEKTFDYDGFTVTVKNAVFGENESGFIFDVTYDEPRGSGRKTWLTESPVVLAGMQAYFRYYLLSADAVTERWAGIDSEKLDNVYAIFMDKRYEDDYMTYNSKYRHEYMAYRPGYE